MYTKALPYLFTYETICL